MLKDIKPLNVENRIKGVKKMQNREIFHVLLDWNKKINKNKRVLKKCVEKHLTMWVGYGLKLIM